MRLGGRLGVGERGGRPVERPLSRHGGTLDISSSETPLWGLWDSIEHSGRFWAHLGSLEEALWRPWGPLGQRWGPKTIGGLNYENPIPKIAIGNDNHVFRNKTTVEHDIVSTSLKHTVKSVIRRQTPSNTQAPTRPWAKGPANIYKLIRCTLPVHENSF